MNIPAYASQVSIGGDWRPANGGGTLPLQNPSTGETVGQLAAADAADIDAAVKMLRALWERMY